MDIRMDKVHIPTFYQKNNNMFGSNQSNLMTDGGMAKQAVPPPPSQDRTCPEPIAMGEAQRGTIRENLSSILGAIQEQRDLIGTVHYKALSLGGADVNEVDKVISKELEELNLLQDIIANSKPVEVTKAVSQSLYIHNKLLNIILQYLRQTV